MEFHHFSRVNGVKGIMIGKPIIAWQNFGGSMLLREFDAKEDLNTESPWAESNSAKGLSYDTLDSPIGLKRKRENFFYFRFYLGKLVITIVVKGEVRTIYKLKTIYIHWKLLYTYTLQYNFHLYY